MDSPGVFTLAAVQIAAPVSAAAQPAIDGLDGMTAVSLEARFAYGSGGLTASAVVRTTFDGTNWLDIARFDFTTAAAVKVANLEGLLSKAVTAYAALGSEGVNDGVLGNQLRCDVTTTGNYTNTTLSVRASVR